MSESRRSFLKKSSLGTLGGILLGGERIPGIESAIRSEPGSGEVLKCGLIGFGEWGREIASVLSRIDELDLTAVCDNYDVMLRRAKRQVPGVSTHLDFREVIDNADIPAIIVATPSHLHTDVVFAALEAGKHVYCEAPLASSIEDARRIAGAARNSPKSIFQAGILYRTEPQYRSVFQFIRSGALGSPAMARAQSHSRQSWRRASPSGDRTRALNWRLDPDLSSGIMGEIGIHQLDTANWMLGTLPEAVTGFGNVLFWKDGRTVPDSVQTILEYPDGVNLLYDASLVSSFDAMYDTYYGSDSTIILRDSRAWMFKEVDAPMLGWEVYARKDKFYKETGIALVANATKLDALGQDPTADDPNTETPLWYALKAFADNYFYGPFDPIVNYRLAFEATVVALTANEAVTKRTRLEFKPEMFEL
jgi:predicted dehydrogenase